MVAIRSLGAIRTLPEITVTTDKIEPIGMDEAAAYAGVPTRTIRYAAEKQYLNAKQISGVWVTTRKDVDDWLQSPKRRIKKFKP